MPRAHSLRHAGALLAQSCASNLQKFPGNAAFSQ
jgi:hypothetical protein